MGPVLIQTQILKPNRGVHAHPQHQQRQHTHTLLALRWAHSVNTVNKLAPIDRGGRYNKTIPGFIEV